MTATILVGDMRDVLATLEPESVHACVTDPPYELSDGRKASADVIALEFMFPENAKIKAEGAGDDCLPFLVHEVLALSRVGIVPTPPTAVPVGAVAFDQDAAGRDHDVEDSGEGAVFISNGSAREDSYAQPPQYLGYFHLELTDRVSMLQALDRAGTGFFAGGIGVGFGVTPSSLPRLVACSRPINLGDQDVRTRNDALAHLIGALAGAEHLPVTRLDLGRAPVERLTTDSALMLCAVLLSGGAKLVRTSAGARRLPSMLEARRVRIVHPLTHRAVELDLVFHPQSIAEKGFMGKEWDGSKIAFDVRAWREVYRVLKPGGYLLAFSGTRTYHEMASAIAMAGFEIRDQILWIFGQGMPKGLNVSKAIDKAAGAEREVVAAGPYANRGRRSDNAVYGAGNDSTLEVITAPATDLARQWDGWNSAIKPACEPVCVARKPFKGTIVNNVLTHGTGAYHVDACRIPASPDDPNTRDSTDHINDHHGIGYSGGWKAIARRNPQEFGGRWPANVCMDEAAAAVLDAMSGERPSHNGAGVWATGKQGYEGGFGPSESPAYGDTGGASRFFYTSKSSQAERNIGHAPGERNTHATVKPIDLMQWLVRLVAPKGGIVLDPFMGSGSTGVACDREGFHFIGIDLDEHNVATARKRIVGDAPLFASVAD